MRWALFLLVSATGLQAQEPTQFQWKLGSTITTHVEQQINVAQTTRDPESQELVSSVSVTKLSLTKQWSVKEVKDSNATLTLQIKAFRQEIARPGTLDKDGKPTVETIVIDSATPEGKEQTASYLNKPIVTLNIDAKGQIVDAKSELGSVSQLKAELPFRVALPETALKVGEAWTRAFPIQLDPPLGTGEKYPAKQTYKVESITKNIVTIATTTTLDAPPESKGELASLAPMLWKGTVTFDSSKGQFVSAKLNVKQTIDAYQGAGTKLIYESSYTETIVPAK